MRRSFPLALLLVAVAAVAPVAAVPDARLAVSGLSIAPETPVVGEPVTVTATVRNSPGSDSAAELTAVYLTDGDERLATATDPGSLSPGDTLAVDLVARFERAGQRNLTVVAVGEDVDNETVRVERPVSVVVEAAAPQVELSVGRPVAGTESHVAVTLSNPNEEAVRDVTLRLDAPGADRDRRTVPTLAGGATATRNVTFTPAEPGTRTVAVDVTYLTNTGVRRTTRYARNVTVAPLRTDVGVAVRPAEPEDADAAAAGDLGGILGGGQGTLQGETDEQEPPDAVTVEVTNFGNAAVTRAVVRPRADDRALPRRYVGRLAPGESATVEVDLSTVRTAANVTAVVAYAVGDERERVNRTYRYRPGTGQVTLTGIDLSFADGRLTVSGNAGNVGEGDVTGLVVAVESAEGVRPAYPQRDYFVGTVEGSEFAPFELTAAVDRANATVVPVRVSYRVDGEPREAVVELPVENALAGEDDDSDDLSLGGAAGVGLGAGAVALTGVGAYVAWRRRRP